MNGTTAAKTVRDVIMLRLDDRLKEKEFRKRYEAWIRDSVTVEVTSMLHEVLCRPVPVEGGIDGMIACYALGLSEGAWCYHDALTHMRPLPQQVNDPELDYSGEEETQNKKGKKS